MDGQVSLAQQVRDREAQAAEHLGTIRRVREQWEMYEVVMRDHAARIEEASVGDDPKNYFSQRTRATRQELDSYVRQLAREQAEVLDAAEREVSSRAEADVERLRAGRAGSSWD